jgi:hypothetical protein
MGTEKRRENGMMEHWNTGFKKDLMFSIIPVFHYS